MDEATPSPADSEKLRALIVDDEAPARERLRRLLEELGDVTIVGEATNGAEALVRCATLDPDLVLLDVRMPGMDGIEAARHLGALDEPPAVIFTTAYDEYALAAFETEAVGYLLKPVRREKLARAVRHAARIAGPQLARLAEQSQLGRRRTQICARLGEQLRLVPIEDVLYFSAGQKYVTLRHRGGRELIDESLRALEQEFAPDFIRIHRNSLVARRYVQVVERSPEGHLFVRLTDGDETLQVSRRYAAEALRQIRTGH
jgi:two-component system response regulator AlgR